MSSKGPRAGLATHTCESGSSEAFIISHPVPIRVNETQNISVERMKGV